MPMSNSERENFFDQAVGLNVVHELLQREHSSTSPDDSEHATISGSLIKVKQVVEIVYVYLYVCMYVCMYEGMHLCTWSYLRCVQYLKYLFMHVCMCMCMITIFIES